MMNDDSPSQSYPVVQWFVARGKAVSVVLALLVLFGGVAGGLAWHQWWLLPVSLVAAAVLLGLLLSYVEVLRIIADTLIPKY